MKLRKFLKLNSKVSHADFWENLVKTVGFIAFKPTKKENEPWRIA